VRQSSASETWPGSVNFFVSSVAQRNAMCPLMPNPKKVLFILKRQGLYGNAGFEIRSSGLYNSAVFCSDMLRDLLNQNTKLVLVTDNNDIDREVANFEPDIVMIEALWVVPDKFEVLRRLHPRVTWVIRNHSAIPFLAQEANSFNWLLQYAQLPNVLVGHNDKQTLYSFNDLSDTQGLYLPNFYPANDAQVCRRPIDRHEIDIGCFGAIRPLKNHLIQAVAAIRYADARHQKLTFHINGTRSEGGDSILSNLNDLFDSHPKHELQTHPWLERSAFLELMQSMDVHMQVSFSETFNVVTADAVTNGVPVVVSPEIKWVEKPLQASPTNCSDIINKLYDSIKYRFEARSINHLQRHNEMAVGEWKDAIRAIN
jgi:hypothetical protein